MTNNRIARMPELDGKLTGIGVRPDSRPQDLATFWITSADGERTHVAVKVQDLAEKVCLDVDPHFKRIHAVIPEFINLAMNKQIKTNGTYTKNGERVLRSGWEIEQ